MSQTIDNTPAELQIAAGVSQLEVYAESVVSLSAGEVVAGEIKVSAATSSITVDRKPIGELVVGIE